MAAAKAKEGKPGGEFHDLYERAIRAVHAGSYADALKILGAIEEGFPSDKELLARVRAFQRICRRREPADEPGNSQPETAEECYDRGVIHHNSGRFDEALSCFRKAIELGDHDVGYVHYAMAATLARQGNGREALDQLKTAIAMGPEARYRAAHDPDLTVLADRDEFHRLLDAKG